MARRPRGRVGDLVGERQRHRLPRPRRLERRGRGGGGRAHRGAPRARRRAAAGSAIARARRSTSTRRTSTACSRTAPRRPCRSTPTRRRCGGWAATRSRPTGRCAGSRSPTPRSCGRSRMRHDRGRQRPRRHRRRRDGPVHGVSRVAALGSGWSCWSAGGSATRRPRPTAGPARSAATTWTRPTPGSRTRRSACGASSSGRPARDVLVRCGCMNIAQARGHAGPGAAPTRSSASRRCQRLGMKTESLDAEALRARFPYLDADLARPRPGRRRGRPARGHRRAHARARASAACARSRAWRRASVARDGAAIRVIADAGEFLTRALVVTAGHGTNDVLSLLPRQHPAGPDHQGPAERGQVLRAARGRRGTGSRRTRCR